MVLLWAFLWLILRICSRLSLDGTSMTTARGRLLARFDMKDKCSPPCLSIAQATGEPDGMLVAAIDAIEREAVTATLAELRTVVVAELDRPAAATGFNNGSRFAFGVVLGLIDKAG